MRGQDLSHSAQAEKKTTECRWQRRCSSWAVSSVCWAQVCLRTGSREGRPLRQPAVSVFLIVSLAFRCSLYPRPAESFLLRRFCTADVGTLPDADHGRKGYRWHRRWRAQVWPSLLPRRGRSKHSALRHTARSPLCIWQRSVRRRYVGRCWRWSSFPSSLGVCLVSGPVS